MLLKLRCTVTFPEEPQKHTDLGYPPERLIKLGYNLNIRILKALKETKSDDARVESYHAEREYFPLLP